LDQLQKSRLPSTSMAHLQRAFRAQKISLEPLGRKVPVLLLVACLAYTSALDWLRQRRSEVSCRYEHMHTVYLSHCAGFHPALSALKGTV